MLSLDVMGHGAKQDTSVQQGGGVFQVLANIFSGNRCFYGSVIRPGFLFSIPSLLGIEHINLSSAPSQPDEYAGFRFPR
jgi:hypothetical protein